jgi:hypothetical protein
MLDKPDAADLLEAIGAFLTNDVVPELSGRKRFHALVAANLARILVRETRRGAAVQEREIARLRELLGRDRDAPLPQAAAERDRLELALNVELVVRIEAGEADDASHGAWGAKVFAHLKESVADKLRIDNPKLLGEVD